MWAIRVVHCGVPPDDVWTTGTGNDFTQRMCEMDSVTLANYVMKVGTCIS